jgi:hypothetical protein
MPVYKGKKIFVHKKKGTKKLKQAKNKKQKESKSIEKVF